MTAIMCMTTGFARSQLPTGEVVRSAKMVMGYMASAQRRAVHGMGPSKQLPSRGKRQWLVEGTAQKIVHIAALELVSCKDEGENRLFCIAP